MIHYHGKNKKKHYFEGWYLKHVKNGYSIAFIPAVHIDGNGRKTASMQIITNDQTYHIDIGEGQFFAAKNRFFVKTDNTKISEKGMIINIRTEDVTVTGRIKYHKFTPLNYNIMGPFALVPFMQCNHGVLSMYHTITGKVKINGKVYDFNDGYGYIEKDYGCSFPETYFWTQCCFLDYRPCSVMLSVADIPFPGKAFTGCIGVVLYRGREYRFATYLGVKIIKYTKEEVILEQKNICLRVNVSHEIEWNTSHSLKAPDKGNMTRTIQECIAGSVRYRFYIDGRMCFDKVSNKASIEIMI